MKRVLKQRISSLLFDNEYIELVPSKMAKGERYSLVKKGVKFELDIQVFDKAFYARLIITNIGDCNSPKICCVNAIDCVFDSFGDSVFYSLTGDNYKEDGEMQRSVGLPCGFTYREQPTGGRPSNTTGFPYFDIAGKKISRTFGIGWAGQWTLEVRANKSDYRVLVGIDCCDFYLKPNESFAFPSVLVCEGETLDESRNGFKQRVNQSFSPKGRFGVEELKPLSMLIGDCLNDEMNTEEYIVNQIKSAKDSPFEVMWADAIWFKKGWPFGVGNFEFKPLLPNGFTEISKLTHEQNRRLLVWSEIERSYPENDINRKHPEMLLSCITRLEFNLVDLGNEDTWNFVFKSLCGFIEQNGIDIYRQDANIDPLIFWNINDEKDRKGVHQLQYVNGLYKLWDKLIERFPKLLIDNCASGGRRLDFETMRRAVSYCSSDYPNAGVSDAGIRFNMMHLQNLNLYIPNVSVICPIEASAYMFRSTFNGSICLSGEKFTDGFSSDFAVKLLEEGKRIRPLYHGNFYQLTDIEDAFYGYQFHQADRGFAIFVRHDGSLTDTAAVSLKEIDKNKVYQVTVSDERLNQTTCELSGGELLAYRVSIPNVRESVLVEYQQKA